MWRSVCQSVPGERHRLDGADSQDHSLVRYVGSAADGALVACVADGAGTAALSSLGARLACEAIVELVADRFETRRTLADIQPSEAVQWCELTRRRLESEAETRRREIRDFASTLCGAVIARRQSIFFQIGDGAIVARRHGALGVVFWPQSGEYLNTTSFLTSPDFQERLQVRLVQGEFADVALFTDGIERLALQFDALAPHAPFFQPLFAAVRGNRDVEALAADLKRFLESDSVLKKNDDDKTLLLACRIADEVRHVA